MYFTQNKQVFFFFAILYQYHFIGKLSIASVQQNLVTYKPSEVQCIYTDRSIYALFCNVQAKPCFLKKQANKCLHFLTKNELIHPTKGASLEQTRSDMH